MCVIPTWGLTITQFADPSLIPFLVSGLPDGFLDTATIQGSLRVLSIRNIVAASLNIAPSLVEVTLVNVTSSSDRRLKSLSSSTTTSYHDSESSMLNQKIQHRQLVREQQLAQHYRRTASLIVTTVLSIVVVDVAENETDIVVSTLNTTVMNGLFDKQLSDGGVVGPQVGGRV